MQQGSNAVINAWLRLDRAISESTDKRMMQSNRQRTPDYFRSGARRLQQRPRFRTLQNDHEQSDLYLTMIDAIQNESKLSIRDDTPRISATLGSQQSISKLTALMKTSGSVVQSIKRIVTVKAYDKQPGITGKQLMEHHKKKMRSEIQELSTEKVTMVLAKTETIHGIQMDLIFDLYSAKCQDNEIGYIPDQAIKFVERFKRTCNRGNLLLQKLLLGPHSCKVVASIIQNNLNFTTLDLSENYLSEQALLLLGQGLTRNDTLVHLNMAHCSLSTESLRLLIAYLPSTLISLNLSHNRINKQGSLILNNFLQQNKLIQILSLEEIGTTVQNLAPGLRSSSSLVSLNISSNVIDSEEFLDAITRIGTLESLNLSMTQLGDQGAETLCTKIKDSFEDQIWSVKILRVDKCQLTVYGLQKLVEAITPTRLEVLNASRNAFGEINFMSVAINLFQSRTLTQIDFSECNLNSQTSVGFGDMSKCSSIKKVYLSGNNFNNEHPKGLAAGLKYIECLDISKCRLGTKGAMLLFTLLEGNQYIADLNLSDNFIPDEAFMHFIEVLKRNRRLVRVDITRNQYTYQTMERIAILLRKNLEHQKQQKIPKIRQQMKDLLCNLHSFLPNIEYDGKQDAMDIERVNVLSRRADAIQALEAEKINQNLQLEKERGKSEKLRIKRDGLMDEVKQLNVLYNNKVSEQQLNMTNYEVEQHTQEREIKAIAIEIREMQNQLRLKSESIQNIQQQYEKRIENLRIEQSTANRRLNQAYLKLNQAQDQLTVATKPAVEKSPKRRVPSATKRSATKPNK